MAQKTETQPEVDSIPARLFRRAKAHPTDPAFGVKVNDRWEHITWLQYAGDVKQAARSLIHLGLKPGQAVSILGFNTYQWVVFHVASMSVGGSGAGIYTTCSPPEVQYIVAHTDSEIILVENKKQFEKLADRAAMPKLRHIVTMPKCEPIRDPAVITWDAFIQLSHQVSEQEFEQRLRAIKATDIGTYIYTSGTTGPPKGVMLSHANLTFTADRGAEAYDIHGNDSAVSYLPLSHIAEQMFTIHVPITCGGIIYFAESILKLPENLREVQPTMFFGVPRVWEKFMAKAKAALDDVRGIRGHLASWARSAAREANTAQLTGKKVSWWLWAKKGLLSATILRKVKTAMGLSRARMCATGAAPIDRSVLEFFAELDIVVHEIYGQSEDCGPTSWNTPGHVKLGSAGKPVKGVEVKISPEDGEILVRGPNVFMGYFKEPDATAETMTSDGFLMSGDVGQFDEEGYLFITGRKKEILITAGGKNISPKNIELALKNYSLIGEAVVVGDRKPFLTALITIDPDQLAVLARERAVDPEVALQLPEVRSIVQQGVDEVNKTLAQVETIKKFAILPRPFTLEHGELTGTLKIKRRVVYQNFAKEIDALYQGPGAAE